MREWNGFRWVDLPDGPLSFRDSDGNRWCWDSEERRWRLAMSRPAVPPGIDLGESFSWIR